MIENGLDGVLNSIFNCRWRINLNAYVHFMFLPVLCLIQGMKEESKKSLLFKMQSLRQLAAQNLHDQGVTSHELFEEKQYPSELQPYFPQHPTIIINQMMGFGSNIENTIRVTYDGVYHIHDEKVGSVYRIKNMDTVILYLSKRYLRSRSHIYLSTPIENYRWISDDNFNKLTESLHELMIMQLDMTV